MATNPITSESLTVDFRSLMKIPVGDRAKAASISPDFLQSILNALTPIQIANAFPNYYKRQLPDVSNFVTSYITSRNGGNFNQTGGGSQGYEPAYYDQDNDVNGSARPAGSELSIKDMKEKLLEKGIDVDNTFGALEQGPILAGDERVQIIQNLSTDKLLELGIEKYQDENGKDLFKLRPVAAESMTDEQIQTEMKKQADNQEGTYRPVYPLSDIDLSPGVINTIAGEALNNKESIDGVINNMLNRVGAQGDWTNLKDVARASGQYAGYRVASEEQAEVIKARIKEIASGKVASNIGAATEFRAEYYVKGEGYGKTFEREARKQGYKQPGPGDNIYAETFAAGPYAPRKAEEVEKIKTENAAKINTAFTPEEIKAYREQSIKEQRLKVKEDLIRETYQTPSPTSSEAIPNKTGQTNVNIGPLEDPYEFWAARNPNNAVLEHNGKAIDREYLTTAMMAAKKFEAENPTKRVELYGPGAGYDVPGSSLGGTRDAGQHLKGNAADWAIYDIDPESGQKIKKSGAYGNYSNKPNHGGVDPEGFALYNEFIQNQELARIHKANQNEGDYGSWGIRNGMLFSDVEWDAMHSDKGGTVDPKTGISAHASPIGRGSVAGGMSESALLQLGIDPNSEAGKRLMTGVAERFGTGEDLTKAAEQSYGVKEVISVVSTEAEEQQKEVAKAPSEISKESESKTATVTSVPPVSVESKETIVVEAPTESKETTVAEIPVPVEPKETTAAAPPPAPDEVRKYALGGNIYEPNEDMTLVDTKTGNPIAQIGNDEKIEKTGNAIQVTPETKLKADELTNKYDSSTEMEDRMSSIEDNMQNQKTPDTTNQIVQKAREPEKTQTETPHRWRESVASAERPVSPSFNRAMARSKFFGEGHHFNRSAPGSQS